jgi:hypothetical protein
MGSLNSSPQKYSRGRQNSPKREYFWSESYFQNKSGSSTCQGSSGFPAVSLLETRASYKARWADSAARLHQLPQKTRYLANRLLEISVALDARDAKVVVGRN